MRLGSGAVLKIRTVPDTPTRRCAETAGQDGQRCGCAVGGGVGWSREHAYTCRISPVPAAAQAIVVAEASIAGSMISSWPDRVRSGTSIR